MAKYSLVTNGIVAQIFDTAPELHESLTVISSPDNVEIGWIWNGIDVTPAPPEVLTQADLRRYLAARCWQVETGGITVNGLKVPTDDRAKTLIEGGASTLADTDTIKFKIEAGWIDLTGLEVRAIRDAIAVHVQACFAMAAALDADIGSALITTTTQIDSAIWPS